MAEQEISPPGQEVAAIHPGEKLFTIILFLAGGAAFGQSLALWLRLSPPRTASAAALPLAVSTLWLVFSLVLMLQNMRKTTAPVSDSTPSGSIRRGLNYALPRPLLVTFAAVVAYCLALLLHISFYIATPLFLWGVMCYLTRKHYLQNMLWTALCMAFIFLVFSMLFKVVLP